MRSIKIFDKSGKEIDKIQLNPAIFNISVPENLIHLALLRQEGNARIATAKVKGRSERSGGGRKPWKQKGTGRARTGSIRAAQWKKGGRIFGPTGEENYSKLMPRKQRVKALLGTLTAKAEHDQILGLKVYDEKEVKTKVFSTMIKSLPIERSVLVVIPKKNDVLQRSARNIANVKVILASYLNIADLLKYNNILVFPETLKKIDTLWGDMFKPTEAKKAAPATKEKVETKHKSVDTKEVKAEEPAVKVAPRKATTAKTVTKTKKKPVAKTAVKKATAKKAPAKPKTVKTTK